MSNVLLPLTGAGDATASVATELIGANHYQLLKVTDGTPGSTAPIIGKSTTPGSTDMGLVTRNIPSTALSQLVAQGDGSTNAAPWYVVGIVGGTVDLTSEGSTKLVGQVTIANPSTAVTVDGTVSANLTSVGSSKLIGRVDINNPTTGVTVDGTVGLTSSTGQKGSFALATGTTGTMGAVLLATGTTGVVGTVAVSSGVVLGAGSSANTIGAIAQGAGSTSVAPWYVVSTAGGAGSTAVDANLTSVGSTKTIGVVGQGGGSTTITPWYVISTAATGGPGSSAVDANLTSVGSTKLVGTVNVSSGVILGAGSSANLLGAVIAGTAGSSANMVGQVALSSGNPVYLGLGTSATYNFMQSIPFSSGNVSRSSISTTVDIQLIAANANRKALVIGNRSTAQTVGIGFSTAVLTTALANVDVFLAPSQSLSFGLQGGLPLYLGPLRGLNLTSTAVAGSVGVTEFT